MYFHVFSCQFCPPGLLPTEAFLLWPSILNVIYYHKSMVTRPESLSNQHHEQELPQAHRTAICWAVSMGNFTCTALCFSFVKVLVTYDASFVQENSANAMVASSCKVSCVPFTSIWCALKNAELPLTMRRNEPAEVHVNTDMLRTCLICWHAACRSLETITAVQTTDLSRATSDGRLFLQRFVTNEWWHVTNEQLNVCWSLCVCADNDDSSVSMLSDSDSEFDEDLLSEFAESFVEEGSEERFGQVCLYLLVYCCIQKCICLWHYVWCTGYRFI